MQTNYIDLLQIHRFDDTVEPTETMQALHDLVRSGSVRYIGASSMWTYQFATLQHIADQRGWTKFISMQNHYNLLYREEEREMIRFCDLNGIGLIPVRHSNAFRTFCLLTCANPVGTLRIWTSCASAEPGSPFRTSEGEQEWNDLPGRQ